MKNIADICEVREDLNTKKMYSCDASIFEVMPDAVVFPKNKEDLSKLIQYASANNTTLTARSAGTCMSGGSLTEGVVIDMAAGFSYIGEIDKEQNTVWVGSGTYHRDIESALTPHGLLFAPYTSSKDLCGIGGMIGNNASGEKSFRYGATIDNIVSLRMMCSDGNEYTFSELSSAEFKAKALLENFEGTVYKELDTILQENKEQLEASRPKVKKNAAGYGLWNIYNPERDTYNVARLIIGSQGTLGIVTDIQLRLVPLPQHYSMLVCRIENLKNLATVVQTMASHLPEGIETYDNHTYTLAQKLLPEDAARAKLGKDARLVVFAQFSERSQEETEAVAEMCKKELASLGFAGELVAREEADSHFVIRRASFKLLKEYAHGTSKAVPFIEDTIVPLEHYDAFLEKLEDILTRYDMTYTYAGHIGDGSIRLIPLVNLETEDAADKVLSLAQEVYTLTISFGGSISVDHNDGIIRTPFLSLQYNPKIISLFEKTKHIFDSKYIFNPGKKVGGSLEYAKQKMIRTNRS
jgi:FAD/FMN-containing dehydrogenase